MSVRATRPPPKAVTAPARSPTPSTRLAAVLSVGERVKAQQQAVPTAFEMRDPNDPRLEMADPDDLGEDSRVHILAKQYYERKLAELKAERDRLEDLPDPKDREAGKKGLTQIKKEIKELEEILKGPVGNL